MNNKFKFGFKSIAISICLIAIWGHHLSEIHNLGVRPYPTLSEPVHLFFILLFALFGMMVSEGFNLVLKRKKLKWKEKLLFLAFLSIPFMAIYIWTYG